MSNTFRDPHISDGWGWWGGNPGHIFHQICAYLNRHSAVRFPILISRMWANLALGRKRGKYFIIFIKSTFESWLAWIAEYNAIIPSEICQLAPLGAFFFAVAAGAGVPAANPGDAFEPGIVKWSRFWFWAGKWWWGGNRKFSFKFIRAKRRFVTRENLMKNLRSFFFFLKFRKYVGPGRCWTYFLTKKIYMGRF